MIEMINGVSLENMKEKRMTTRADLHREYARVIEMCEGTSVESSRCVRLVGCGVIDSAPVFTNDPDQYLFAIGIVEDRPVFVGDTLYQMGVKRIVEPYSAYDWSQWSWNPPKKTVTLRDMPVPTIAARHVDPKGTELILRFNNTADRDAWFKALVS